MIRLQNTFNAMQCWCNFCCCCCRYLFCFVGYACLLERLPLALPFMKEMVLSLHVLYPMNRHFSVFFFRFLILSKFCERAPPTDAHTDGAPHSTWNSTISPFANEISVEKWGNVLCFHWCSHECNSNALRISIINYFFLSFFFGFIDSVVSRTTFIQFFSPLYF